MVPQMKNCFRNSQMLITRLLYHNDELVLSGRLQYREGLAHTVITIEHGWLVLDGEHLDITLGWRDDVKYLAWKDFDAKQVVKHNAKTGMYNPMIANPYKLLSNE
jgi:hypothetical protein